MQVVKEEEPTVHEDTVPEHRHPDDSEVAAGSARDALVSVLLPGSGDASPLLREAGTPSKTTDGREV